MSDTKSDNSEKQQQQESTATEKKLSPLERVKQRQAQMRQGLQKKTQGANAVRDGGGGSAGTDAPPPRTNTPRRAGGS